MTNKEPPKILVIDDEEAIVLLLKTVLDLYDYNSFSCLDSQNAVCMAKELKPDLIILDVAMPDKDGYQVCKELKSLKETRNIPIIMLTALALNQDKKLGLESGANAFIFKPFDPENVIAEISRLLT